MNTRTEGPAGVDVQLEQFIRQMPKVELHLHLEGTIRPTTLLDLARRHGVELPANDIEGLLRWYRFRDFPHFVEVWLAILNCLRDGADFARITRELGEAALAQRVRYAQVTFVPLTHQRYKGMPYDEVWDGMREGAAWVERELGVRLQFVPDFPRNRRPGDGSGVEATAEWAVAHQQEGIVGLGLGGYEVGNPPDLFEEVFQYARRRGLRCWPHAGETDGPASIWGAVHVLGADRIAHGIRAVEDPALLAYLAEHGIGCDVCPTSNICLGIYPSLQQHPIRRLIEAGVPVTLNSDDPPMFNTTLTSEFLALAQAQAFTAAELGALVRTGVEVSFLPETEKATLRARIDTELAAAARAAGVEL
jgi:adenosine deaminase